MKLLALALCTFTLPAAVLAQNQSVYTSTKTSDCKTIRAVAEEAGSYEGECRGVGGYKVRLLEGDLRQSLTVITPAKKKQPLEFWQFYGNFSAIGEKIEWRTKKGVPVALIARYNVSDAEDASKTTSYLLVAKIGAKGSCVTDIVKPMAKQNEEARRLADIAAGKQCKEPE